MSDYDERLMDSFAGDPEHVDKLSDEDFHRLIFRKKKTERGRCYECGCLLFPWELGWSGKDGTNHLAEYDMGGGRVEELPCGPVFREEE